MQYLEYDPELVEEQRTVERFGYAHAPLRTKLSILKTLCERQFDWNPKFKEAVGGCSARELRLLPVGRDKEGKAYFYQLDAQHNLRIYSEEPDDDAGRTWACRAKSPLSPFPFSALPFLLAPPCPTLQEPGLPIGPHCGAGRDRRRCRLRPRPGLPPAQGRSWRGRGVRSARYSSLRVLFHSASLI